MSKEEKQVKESNTEGAINRLTRRIDDMQKTIDVLVNKDKTREQMLEEVLASLASLKQFTVSTRDHHDNLTQEIKAEVVESKMEVKDKVADLSDKIDQKKVIKVVNKNILNKILFWRG